MANAYYDYNNGLTANDGLTPSTAKSTRTEAQGVAGAGDRVIAVDGIQTLPASEGGDIFFDFDDNFIESSETFRGATLRPEATETTRCARSSGTITPHIIENLVFDGQANGGLSQAFDIIQYAVADRTLRMHGCEFIAGNSYGFLCSNRRGRIELVNCKASGSPTAGQVVSTVSLSGDGNQVVDIQGFELDGSASSGSAIGIDLVKINNLTNTLALLIKGVVGTLTATGTASVVGMNIKSVDPIIANFDLKVVNEGTGTGHFGVIVQGQSVAVATGPIISRGAIDFQADAGYAIALGQSAVDANVSGGEVSGNRVTGRYYASDTPHGYLMGQGVSGATMRGNIAKDIYVGYLASKCTSGTIEGNVAFDCYGTSYYIKGTTDITVKDNVSIVAGKWDIPTDKLGVLSVAPQGATNTAGATVQENLIIVADVSKIHSLAYIEDASQVCSFVRNTYIIPDTVDVSEADLFSYKVGASVAANNTLAEWNAQAEVTDDVIVQLPVTEIASIIQNYREDTGRSLSITL